MSPEPIRIDTFVSASRRRRSPIWRLVTYLPSWPAKGELLTEKRTLTVGGSIAMRGSDSCASGGQTVSPISIVSTPAMIAISPADADSRSTRSRPCGANSLVMRKLCAAPDSGIRTTVTPRRSVPRSTRPITSRPTNSSQPSVTAWNCSGPSVSTTGAGACSRIRSSSGRRSLRSRLGRERRGALLRGRVDDREVELAIVRAELDEQIEDLVDDFVRALLGAVDLVDHDDRLQPARQRLAEHEARLRHHALDRVDEQQHRVDHAHHALDLAAEVGVARRVDELDPHALVLDRRVLGVDRDAALALEVLAVHRALLDLLVDAEGAGLAQESIEQRRLAVIDVRNDGEVADVFAGATHRGGEAKIPSSQMSTARIDRIHIFHGISRELSEALARPLRARAARARVRDLDPRGRAARRASARSRRCSRSGPPRGIWAGATRLRLFQMMGAGVDALLPAPDLPAAVRIANARGIHGPHMSEFALAMVLALAKRVPRALEQSRDRLWKQYGVDTIAGRTLGDPRPRLDRRGGGRKPRARSACA